MLQSGVLLVCGDSLNGIQIEKESNRGGGGAGDGAEDSHREHGPARWLRGRVQSLEGQDLLLFLSRNMRRCPRHSSNGQATT